jgi:glucose/sorbosone dehydrogenase
MPGPGRRIPAGERWMRIFTLNRLVLSMAFASGILSSAAAQIPAGVTYEAIYDISRTSFNQPTFVGGVPNDPGQFIVGERRGGFHRMVKNGSLYEKKPWFSVAANATTHWDGAWALEFHPKFLQNRLFYILYRKTGTDTRSVIEEWTCEADLSAPRKVRDIVFFNQKSIHSSGDIRFGPDGYLYSAQGDRDQGAEGGQLMTEMWGKVIRIDVDHKDPGLEYAIPPDNPFKGTTGARPEIWAAGFRMPYRFGFDRLTGDLYLGDVGDVTAEEVDLVQAGKNYGAGKVEGACRSNCAGLTDPVASLPTGCVIGGVVYRNDASSAFYGAYIFADYQLNKLQAFKLNAAKTGVTELKAISGTPPGRISAMGQDAAGDIYVATYLEIPDTSRTHVYRLKHAELKPATVALQPRMRGSAWGRPEALSAQSLGTYDLAGRPLDASHRGSGAGVYLVRDKATGGIRKMIFPMADSLRSQ